MLGYSQIEKVRISYMGTEKIKNLSVTHPSISNSSLYNGDTPVSGGLYDARMGTLDYMYQCESCLHDKKLCPGHAGHIDLSRPILNPVTLHLTKQYLKVLCFNCSSAVSTISEKGFTTPKKTCPVCKTEKFKVTQSKGKANSFIFTYQTAAGETTLTTEEINDIFSKVSDATVEQLGLSKELHPKICIWNALYIPPPTMRPALHSASTSGMFKNDITLQIQHIITCNEGIKNTTDDIKRNKEIQKLQMLVYDTYVSNTSGRIPAFGDTIKSKSGDIRKNLLGKTSKNIGRNTITGNNSIKIDEFGISIKYAKTFQVQEAVTDLNFERLNRAAKNGIERYPGATKVLKRLDGKIYALRDVRKKAVLELGDILYRDLVDGDLVIFNRQPSLDKGSVLAHRVKVTSNKRSETFELNVIACGPFNADFDGDQMNGISTKSYFELLLKLNAVKNFMNDRNGMPVYGTTQDSDMGEFVLTRESTAYTKDVVCYLLSNTDLTPVIENKIYTGKEVVSLIFQETPFMFENNSGWYHEEFKGYINYNEGEKRVIFRDGVMVSGVLDKKNTGPGKKSIFYNLFEKYGPEVALKKIFQLQQCTSQTLAVEGETVSAHDISIPKICMENIRREVENTLMSAEESVLRYSRNQLIPPLGMKLNDYFEEIQLNLLKVKSAQYIFSGVNCDTNGLGKLILTGTKGNIANFSQIIGCVGQKTYTGKRIRERFTLGRVDPYAQRFSLSPQDRGFITAAYGDGTDVQQTYHGCIAARKDLINKGFQTAAIGYASRQSMLCIGAARVDKSGNVRTSIENVISLSYANYGFSPGVLKRITYFAPTMTVEEVKKKYMFKYSDDEIYRKEIESILKHRKKIIEKELKLEALNYNYTCMFQIATPVDIEFIYADNKSDDEETKDVKTMMETVKTFRKKLPYLFKHERLWNEGIKLPKFLRILTKGISYLIEEKLRSNKLLFLTPNKLQTILMAIHYRIQAALVIDVNVGCIASAAISQPRMQTTLDSHHKSVTGEIMNVNKSDEIFDAVSLEAEASPFMYLRLKDKEAEANFESAQTYATRLESLNLNMLLRESWILFEDSDNLIYKEFEDDKDWMDKFNKASINKKPTSLTKWCIRLEFDNVILLLKNIDMAWIAAALKTTFPSLYVVFSSDIGVSNIMRIYLPTSMQPKFKTPTQQEEKMIGMFDMILSTSIKGFSKIKSARAIEISGKSYLDNNDNLQSCKGKYAIVTNGTCIEELNTCEFIDDGSIVSDSINDTYNNKGVCAAEQKIVLELITLFGVGDLSIVHDTLASQIMTYTGKPTPFRKRGIEKRDPKNVLLQMAAESPFKTLTKAASRPFNSLIYGLHAPMLVGAMPDADDAFYLINEDIVKSQRTTGDTIIDSLF